MSSVLALDYGSHRVGVAKAATTSLAFPLTTLDNSDELIPELEKLIKDHEIDQLVVGLPRNLAGVDTDQTKSARSFAAQLKHAFEIPVYLVDEAATSIEAEASLKAGRQPYQKGDIDALAAALILENFLANERYIEQA